MDLGLTLIHTRVHPAISAHVLAYPGFTSCNILVRDFVTLACNMFAQLHVTFFLPKRDRPFNEPLPFVYDHLVVCEKQVNSV